MVMRAYSYVPYLSARLEVSGAPGASVGKGSAAEVHEEMARAMLRPVFERNARVERENRRRRKRRRRRRRRRRGEEEACQGEEREEEKEKRKRKRKKKRKRRAGFLSPTSIERLSVDHCLAGCALQAS